MSTNSDNIHSYGADNTLQHGLHGFGSWGGKLLSPAPTNHSTPPAATHQPRQAHTGGTETQPNINPTDHLRGNIQ